MTVDDILIIRYNNVRKQRNLTNSRRGIMGVNTEKNINFEKKRIHISSKRQITIPAKYYDALNLDKDMDCIYSGDMLILMPVKNNDLGFTEEILADLINQGYSGKKLLEEFKKTNRKIRPAVEQIIAEADKIAEKADEYYTDKTAEIFSDDE